MIHYYQTRKTFSGFGSWTAGISLSALSILFLGFRSILPDFISIIVANSVAIVAMFFFYAGFKQFAEEKIRIHFHIIHDQPDAA